MTICNHDSTECFFNNKEEELFLYSLLNPEMEVLEWGSGSSTRAIASRVKSIVSIEHQIQWYNIVKKTLPSNAELHYVSQNKPEGAGHDGTLDQYRDYVNRPTMFKKKFDLIFVDGRARVECARVAVDLLKPGGIILIHDIFNPNPDCDRPEYYEVLDFLERLEGVWALWAFKPKGI